MLVVTSASAWLRLVAQPRAACADWPACRSAMAGGAALASRPATVDGGGGGSGGGTAVAGVRLVHRVAATAALLGIVAALVMAWRAPRGPQRRPALAWAATLLVLALGLSALGVATPGAASAAVLLGNLLGGLMMVGASVRLWSHAAAEAAGSAEAAKAPVPPALATQARWLMALLFVQVALGALSGVSAMPLAAPLHLVVAMGALPWAVALGSWAWRSGHARAGAGVLAAALVQLLLGISAVNGAAAAEAVVLHNLGAALGIAALAAVRR